VPVQYEIDLTRLTTQLGTFVDLDDAAVLRQQIADGLRAQLQMESIVTGQLYIELAYRPDAAPPELESRPTAWPEIPTTPVAPGRARHRRAAWWRHDEILFQVNEMLEDVDMPEINAAVVASAQAVERLVESPEIRRRSSRCPG
jgi:paraquat-inducible protein B